MPAKYTFLSYPSGLGCIEHSIWYRSYGNELWEFDDLGYMRKRFASINDQEIAFEDRRIL